jgi:hypothetical protein
VRRRCILGLTYSAYLRLESCESVIKSLPLKPWGSGPLWHGRFWGSGLEYVEHIEPKIQGRHGFGDLMIFRHRCLLMKTTCCLSSQDLLLSISAMALKHFVTSMMAQPCIATGLGSHLSTFSWRRLSGRTCFFIIINQFSNM